ncbi:hypothetical protein LOD99_15543 [Oopsacas minuta]|uniref:Uncharacterized protein n=1 Tax=Oopsacas minuta TaxID=111878 RepID=A0AAV7KAV3_9METZ|nr:hypothetical protein LOD99_15543 [Oopsacas minuta]
MKPTTLKSHMESVHPTYVHKNLRSLQYLERSHKPGSFDSTRRFQQQNDAALTASYELSQMIAKSKKPHSIDETLIAPCVEITVKRMLEEDHSKKVVQVSLSNTTIQRRYCTLMKVSKIKLLQPLIMAQYMRFNSMNLQILNTFPSLSYKSEILIITL